MRGKLIRIELEPDPAMPGHWWKREIREGEGISGTCWTDWHGAVQAAANSLHREQPLEETAPQLTRAFRE